MTTEHDEFWGDEAGWSTSPDRDHTSDVPLTLDATPSRGISGKASRLWGSLLTSGSTATRAHRSNADGAIGQHVEVGSESPIDNECNEVTEVTEEWDEGWNIEPTPTSTGGVDPLLARFGGAAVVLTLLIPVAIGLRSGSNEQLLEAATAASAEPLTDQGAGASPAVTTPVSDMDAPATSGPTSSATAQDLPTSSSEPETPGTATPGSVTRSVAELDGDFESSSSTAGNIADPAVADSPAERVEPECPIEYEVVVGDFWIRIADGAGVSTSELLALNGASSATPLYPGSSICLPGGSSTPPPPPAPEATVPATTAPATTAAPTTVAPTTVPPTTAAPAPTAPADIEAIIRHIWPDELEEQALSVAWRESKYIPTAKNYCCYGIFQMYWDVHKGWLSDMGITSADQLYDPATNTRAAYALYQRAGGWGPWGG